MTRSISPTRKAIIMGFMELFSSIRNAYIKYIKDNIMIVSNNKYVFIRPDNKKIVITTNYIPVEISTTLENNNIVKVKITSVTNGNPKGEIL